MPEQITLELTAEPCAGKLAYPRWVHVDLDTILCVGEDS